MNRWILIAALAACLAASAAENRLEEVLARGPYVQLATTHSIAVVWRTRGSIEPCVWFGENSARLDRLAGPGMTVARRGAGFFADRRDLTLLRGASKSIHQYETTLTGLQPDTRYYYAVYDGSRRLAGGDSSHWFQTAPRAGVAKPLRFWVTGDSGTGRPDQARVYAVMTHYTAGENHEPDLFLHVGDMAYSRGRDSEFQSRFFEVYERTLSHTVCWPAMGNHEGYHSQGTNATGVGPYFDAYVLPMNGEAGGEPSHTESFYSFDWGRAHFIALNSHDEDRTPSGRMARWLRVDLAQTAAGGNADWLIAYFHHAPYSKGSHDSDKEKELVEMRRYLMPILEDGGVDLVLTGHSHIYERSMLMDGAYATNTTAAGVILDDGDGDPQGDGPYRKSAGLLPHRGTVQVVTGNGGGGMGRKGSLPLMRRILVAFGSTLVDIDGDTLTGVMLAATGEIADRFRIVKRGQVDTLRVPNPWQPLAWSSLAGPALSTPAAEPPDRFVTLVPPRAAWHYLAGEHAGVNWANLNYVERGWQAGPTPIGFGYPQCQTRLEDMRNRYTTVYLRREFELDPSRPRNQLGLLIDFDDGFIAYLNGTEVARVNVGHDCGPLAKGIRTQPARGPRYYPLKNAENLLRPGRNVLAIEGHTVQPQSGGFLLDPCLLMRSPAAIAGQ